jgi:DNA-binding NtrC family response regulator
MRVLYTWVGRSDLNASVAGERAGAASRGRGPVADALLFLAHQLDRAVLLFDYAPDEADAKERISRYVEWLELELFQAGHGLALVSRAITKGDPTSFNWVYDAMRGTVSEFEHDKAAAARHYLVGPGTPTMAACTLIIARLGECAGTLWQTDVRSPQGCRRLELPVDLSLRDAPDPASSSAERAPGEQSAARPEPAEGVITCSPSTKRAWELAARAAHSQWPVLILGSTGTGKEELARHIHRQSGGQKPFVALNCGAIPENLIESELFGHKKGAFTGATENKPGVFEAARDGIVFLDEIGELPLGAQSRFLRVLQEKKVTRLGEHEERSIQCRIIAATHRHLWQAVQEGRFRADLYYRLAGIILTLDELAARPEDLTTMIDHFWEKTVSDNPGFPGRKLSPEARERLLAHPWPGNVRELKATLVRIAFLAQKPLVSAVDVELALSLPMDGTPTVKAAAALPAATAQADARSTDLDFKANTKRFQRELILQVLAQTHGNKSRAAQRLGITPQHLARLLKG